MDYFLAGVIGSFSGTIIDKESKYLGNMASENACNFYQFLSNVTIESAYFETNMAFHNALMTVSTNCQLTLSNVVINQLQTLGGGINLENSIEAKIQNISFLDYFSFMGPAISLFSLSSKLLLYNLSFQISPTHGEDTIFPGKFLGVWDSQILLTKFITANITGKGLFDVQFNSQVDFEILDITNNVCVYKAKGCLFFIDANSSVSISDLTISRVTTFNSLIFVENSRCFFFNLVIDIALMELLSVDKYFFILDSSNVTFSNFELHSLSAKFMYVTASSVTFQSGYAENVNAFQVIPEKYYMYRQGTAVFFFYQSFKVQFFNVTVTGFYYYQLGVL